MSRLKKSRAEKSSKSTKPHGTQFKSKKNIKTGRTSKITRISAQFAKPRKEIEHSGNASSDMSHKSKSFLKTETSHTKRKKEHVDNKLSKKQRKETTERTEKKSHLTKQKTVKHKKKKLPECEMASDKLQKECRAGHSKKRLQISDNGTDVLAVKFEPKQISSNWMTLLKTAPPKKTFRPQGTYSKKAKSKKEVLDPLVTETTVAPDIWFDDVDDMLLDISKKAEDPVNTNDEEGDQNNDEQNPLVKPQTFDGLTRAVAMDCEMVGVGEGGKDSILARVSLVNHFGKCILDKYVTPKETVTDYRTHVSGIRPEHLHKGEAFKSVQKEVSNMIDGRLLVGHALKNDLQVLFLDHPRKMIRDTSHYKPFRRLFQGRNPSLKKLSEKVLGVKVQEGEHNSIQDAQAAMRLYTMYRKQWEKEMKEHRRTKKTVIGHKLKKRQKNTIS